MRRISSRPWQAVMSSDDAFIDAAASIGRRVVADAVWHDGRCSWMGAVVDQPQLSRAEYRALGPDLYDGTAGVGLFLAHLAAVTGDAAARRTAVGAMRHALAHAALTTNPREGFHEGSLGIVWAAARAATLLDEERLHASARSLPVVTRPPLAADRCPDVGMGAAGSIIALLVLAHAFDEPRLVRDARAAGEKLIGSATVTRHGWSWGTPVRRRRRHLCGLLHGAGGIGSALLELFAATGDERFRTAAIEAFAYERSWLDIRSGTWPDLRIGGQRRGAVRRVTSPAVGTWCHGEGGIALTRLRALDVVGREACQDAEIALEATRRELAASLPYEIADLTLCHGAAGAADVLLCAEDALGGRWVRTAGLAVELGRVAIERHGAGGDWPCGPLGGSSPSLFRGVSGIGWWFLRLHDRSLPSPVRMPICG
jgi:lantibiotic biosynthesis protein